MVAIKSHIRRIMEEHVASCGFSDEDQTTHLKEEVGLRRGNVPSNCTQHGCIATIQSLFSESDDPRLSCSFLYKLMFSLLVNSTFD